jgi:hypothetical protein
MRKKNKKKWTTPELTVVVRGKPEEVVLTLCKYNTGASGGGYTVRQNMCNQTINSFGFCASVGCFWSSSS